MTNAEKIGISRRTLIKTGLLGTGVLAIGAIGYRVAALPSGKTAGDGGVLSKREMAIVSALALAYFPQGNKFNLDADEAAIAGYVDRYLAQFSPMDRRIVRSLFWLYDQGTIFSGHFRPVRLLSTEEARAYVKAWENSRFGWRRDLAMSLRTVLGLAFFAQPKARAALGFEEPCGKTGPTLLRPGGKS